MDAWMIILIAAFVIVDAAITLVFVKALKAKRAARDAEDAAPPVASPDSSGPTDAMSVARDMGLGN